MLTLDVVLQIPDSTTFSVVGEDAFLLNMQTNTYYSLEQVGARLWELLAGGKGLRESYQILLGEYEVDSLQLEQDVLQLINDLSENGLVEVTQ